MTDLVNGSAATPDSHGVVYGSGATETLAGGSGNDILQGGAGVDAYYGGAGNDTFILKASDFSSSDHGVQAVIYDFGGAGGWSATNNDFIALEGFGAGSTITLDHVGTPDAATAAQGASLLYYDIHDTATGNTYEILVKSMDGHQLAAGDYNFYGSVSVAA
jgi:Ca2+-binding RTX toxin-like protein